MTEKDHIKELFSQSLENHSMSVRPEVWNGLQAKMAAAGMTTTATAAAAKGMSVLTKWIIGGTAAAVVGVTTTVLVMQSSGETTQPKATAQISQEKTTATPQETPPVASNGTTTSSGSEQQSGTNDHTAQQLLPSGIQQLIFDPKSPTQIVQANPTDELPIVQPTVIPPNQDTPEVKFAGLENKEITPEATIAGLSEEQIEAKETVLIMPNVFNPNGDGINDEYFVTSSNISEAQIIIQNTDNKVIYRSDDINFRWNGRINNTEDQVEEGMYACVILYKDQTGKSVKKIQLFKLIR